MFAAGKAVGASMPLRGESTYTVPGSYTWVCPVGVTSVSVVCVGAGGGAWNQNGSAYRTGGGGGALGYKNNISVTPGTGYTVVVGAGGKASLVINDGSGTVINPTAGGQSYFNTTGTVRGGGGGAGAENILQGRYPTASSYTGDGGGAGGQSGPNGAGTGYGGGGGGAGGYAGAGGSTKAYDGYNVGNSLPAIAPTGGAGAAGREVPNYFGGGGGGVGLYGQGSNGSTSLSNGAGGGGSGGQDGEGVVNAFYGAWTNGGMFGGGGGICGVGGNAGISRISGNGGNGAVRIVWPGDTRLFPSTDVGTP